MTLQFLDKREAPDICFEGICQEPFTIYLSAIFKDGRMSGRKENDNWLIIRKT